MSVKAVDTWSATEYNKTASFVYSTKHTAPILTLLDPKSGDRIIDFGCGTGEVTLELSELVADTGIVVGVDSSQSMVSTITLPAERGPFLISGRRSTRLRKTGWKTLTPKTSRRWTTSLPLSLWSNTGDSIRSLATPRYIGANGIRSALSAAPRRF